MKVLLQFITPIVLIATLFGCREKYVPPQITANPNYLVVDGVIAGNDTTFIKLSRTTQLGNGAVVQAEAGAIVTVESDAYASYVIKETKTRGTYSSGVPLVLNPTAKYRLRIIANTNTHATYLSDFVPVKNSPPIDSVGYSLPANGLQVYANSHDDAGNTRYYRWDYIETWQFNANYDSEYIELNGQWIIPRTAAQQVFNCWGNNSSTDIVLASSSKLTRDVMYQAPITIVPALSQKISIKYSILVKQYALTLDAFNFWQLLKKNTEQLGSIFDAQPSSITGNIHNIADYAEPVLGYISTGSVQQKRIFVDNTALPTGWGKENPFPTCSIDTIWSSPLKTPNYYDVWAHVYLVTSPIINPKYPLDTAWYGAGRACADCTLRGVTKKPSFWQ